MKLKSNQLLITCRSKKEVSFIEKLVIKGLLKYRTISKVESRWLIMPQKKQRISKKAKPPKK